MFKNFHFLNIRKTINVFYNYSLNHHEKTNYDIIYEHIKLRYKIMIRPIRCKVIKFYGTLLIDKFFFSIF